jgi:hypothetical protein
MARQVVLLLLAAAALGQDADEYFEIGVTYLKQGFFGPARRAFGESLVQAPAEPVPLAFMGLAAAAEGRSAREAAWLLRQAYGHLPEGKTLTLDLAELLPSRRALRILQNDYRRRLARADEKGLKDVLTVAAFLEAYDGSGSTTLLERLEREFPGDAFATRLRAGAPPSSAPTSPPTSSAPPSAGAGSRSSRIRS